jgi:microsomal dipeptidase-like Zn-dependent dipeptidase
MHRRFVLALCLMLAIPSLHAQTKPPIEDFPRWERVGDAFKGQPIEAADILTNPIVPITVGGDYWRDVTYPLGQRGKTVIATAQILGNAATGTLTSPRFYLVESSPYFSVLVGGTNDFEHERVELQILPLAGEVSELEQRIREWRRSSANPYAVARDGDYLTLIAFTGGGYEQLRQEIVQLPPFVFGHEARVKLSDTSASGHLNVDLPTLSPARERARPTPVWGYADFHTHPMDYMAFGGLNGVRTLCGMPGGTYDNYVHNPFLVNRDLAPCPPGHGGGPFAETFLNAVQKVARKPSLGLLIPHGELGAPDFPDWPSFLASTHQQMHITQIRRNYDGGLRLMVALATDNLAAQYMTSHVESHHVRPPVPEQLSVAAQLAGMQELALLNASWMQIAYTPEEARSIILHDKLAVILGVEVDQLGTYVNLSDEKPFSITEEVEYLWDLGARVVTPIHAVDNKIGGPAVFETGYDSLNDLIHRKSLDLSWFELFDPKLGPWFFDTKDDETCYPSDKTDDGECVQLYFGRHQRVYLGHCWLTFFQESPCIHVMFGAGYSRGQKNKKGLTDRGRGYLNALMDRGMIIDTAHMSDASVDGTYEVILQRLQRDHADKCATYTWKSESRPDCNKAAYPAIISHAHFREQAFYGEHDTFPPSEYDISVHNLELVKRIGGVVGPFVAEERVSTPWNPTAPEEAGPLKNDCAQSSKSFAYSFHYAASKLSGVGMATDFTFIPSVAPRFGEDSCWAWHQTTYPHLELFKHGSRYDSNAQTDRVAYEDDSAQLGVSPRQTVPLKRSRLGLTRTYDINTEGVAYYGMIPDMLQDLKNVGFPREDFERLFNSAEAYITMWEKTERVAAEGRRAP